MGRRKAREKAFTIIFSMDFTGTDPEQAISDCISEEEEVNDDNDGFVAELVNGVYQNKAELDSLIKKYIKGYTAERVSKVSMNALRLCFYEIKYRSDIPMNVSANEAIELVKKYEGDEAKGFVNGILGAYIKDVGSSS